MDLAHALGEYLDYLAVERGELPPNTVAAYRRDLTRYLDWLAAEKIVEPADAIAPDVERHLEALAEAGLSPASLCPARGLGHQGLPPLHGAGQGVCDELPTADMPLPAKPARLPDVLSREQAGRSSTGPFPQMPTGLRDRAVLEVLYGCGLRAQRACAASTAAPSCSTRSCCASLARAARSGSCPSWGRPPRPCGPTWRRERGACGAHAHTGRFSSTSMADVFLVSP